MPRNQKRSLPSQPPRRRFLTRGRLALLALVGLALLIFFLPAIVAATSLRQVAIDWALIKFQGRVTVGSASLGWLSPVRLGEIVATDDAGNVLARIERVETARPLLALLTSSDWGQIELHQPQVHLHTWEGGSNLEQAIEEFLQAKSTAKPLTPVSIRIVSGSMLLTTEGDGRQRRAEQLQGTVQVGGSAAPLAIDVDGRLIGADGIAGSANLSAQIDTGSQQIEFRELSVILKADHLPLEPAVPLLRRGAGPADAQGVLTGRLHLAWSRDSGRWLFQSEQMVLADAALWLPVLTGAQRWSSSHAAIRGAVELDPSSLVAQQLVCELDFGRVSADGRLDWPQLSQALLGGRIPDTDFRADGRVDLARLSTSAPQLLPWHQDVRIQSGEIKFDASSSRQADGRRAIVNVEASRLVAERGGQQLAWHRPVRIAATIRQDTEQTILESALCESNFLRIQGHAQREHGRFTMQGDLGKLLAELRQFFPLDLLQANGQLDGEFGWNVVDGFLPLGARPIAVAGKLTIWPPAVAPAAPKPDWEMDIKAQGHFERDQTIRLSQGELSLRSAAQTNPEKLLARLSAPVVNPGPRATWHLDVEFAGQLKNWLARLRPLLPADISAAGAVQLTGKLTVSPALVSLADAVYRVDDFALDRNGLAVREPRIEGGGQFGFSPTECVAEIVDGSFACSAVSARGRNVRIDLQQGRATGELAYRADLGRLSRWFAPSAQAGGLRLFGQAQGSVLLESRAGLLSGRITSTIDDFVVANLNAPRAWGMADVLAASTGKNWSVRFRDQRVQLRSSLQAAPNLTRVQIQDFQLDTTTALVAVSGTIEDLPARARAELNGNWTPKWDQVNRWLQARVGKRVEIQGGEAQTLEIRGPLRPIAAAGRPAPLVDPELTIATGVHWSGGQLMGMPFGASRMSLQLKNSIAAVQATDFTFSGGTARLGAQMDLSGPKPMLILPRAAVFEQIQLTPEICAAGLKYASPLLANVTQAQGRFSLLAEPMQIPLDGSWNGDLRSTLVIHSASIGPGPLGQQIVGVADQIIALADGRFFQPPGASPANWLTLPEQSVPLVYHDGRVYHDAMQFQIRDVAFRTRGVVGLDQSVNVVADIPVLDRWVDGKRFWQALKGQTVPIPIIGSLGQPLVDGQAFSRWATQILGQSAGGLLRGELDNVIRREGGKLENDILKGFKQLFGPDR